jgi:hypothetical protein
MIMELTTTQVKALDILKKEGPMRRSTLGVKLWGDERQRQPQSYCLPAGKLVKSLLDLGLVYFVYLKGYRGQKWELVKACEVKENVDGNTKN